MVNVINDAQFGVVCAQHMILNTIITIKNSKSLTNDHDYGQYIVNTVLTRPYRPKQ